MQTKRFASKSIANCYPFPCQNTLKWERSSNGFTTNISLNPMEAGQLLIPCLSIPRSLTRFSARLRDNSGNTKNEWLINPGLKGQPTKGEHASVSTHIDYFHIHQPLTKAELVLEIYSIVQPEKYLLVLAFTQTSTASKQLKHTRQYQKTHLVLPQRSQMIESSPIRDRICSPTCIQMVLEHHGLLDDKTRLIADCFDSHTDLYGVWPINIAAASKRGLIGAIESFNDFNAVCLLLEKSIPLVCSIRFNPGQLKNAPLHKTPGHLVILAGVDEHSVKVYDPAADTEKTVLRNYARNEFHKAWIDNNGIAYVLVPCASGEDPSSGNAQ